ncbi:hypothetical protein VPHD148_0029 [Vibrio phage D148]
MSNKGKNKNVTKKEAKRLRQRGTGLSGMIPLTLDNYGDTIVAKEKPDGAREIFMGNHEPVLAVRDMTPEEIETGVIEEEKKPPMHIDRFIDFGTSITKRGREENEDYARWMFNHWRLPAITRMAFEPFMKEHKLFCEYEGEKYRVTGASRLGDVWITQNFEQDCGYQKRVLVEECSKWSKS